MPPAQTQSFYSVLHLHVLQYAGLVTKTKTIFVAGSLEGPPVFQLSNPFPYMQGRSAEIVQSSLSSHCATCWLAPSLTWIIQLDHHLLALSTGNCPLTYNTRLHCT